VTALLFLLALPQQAAPATGEPAPAALQATPPATPAPPAAREAEVAPPSKKQAWLAAKDDAPAHPHRPAPQRAAQPAVSLFNAWTHEILPVVDGQPTPQSEINSFLRCHYTNQSRAMDPRLLPTVLRAVKRFRLSSAEIVSGYRAPKYNLMLRKKGHEVARDSEHPRGEAVDFRLAQVPTRTLLRFVRSLRLGGVGYYPESRFVHCDTGRIRYWRGR
jgi:uncharacterized protein YcbK (DUF882 family)